MPAQIDPGFVSVQVLDALDQKAFDVELLDVDEGRLFTQVEVALLTQVKREYLVISGKSAPHTPLNAFGFDALVNTQSLENFQGFLGIANASG